MSHTVSRTPLWMRWRALVLGATLIASATICEAEVQQIKADGAASNLIVDPGLESQEQFAWREVSVAASERVPTHPHSGGWCLRVSEGSGSVGQANSGRFAVRAGPYYVEAWVRVDPAFPDVTTFDVQFLDAEGAFKGAEHVGRTKSTQWTRLRRKVIVPDGVASGTLRLIPAKSTGDAKGACFADDFYFAPFATAVQEGRTEAWDGLPLPKVGVRLEDDAPFGGRGISTLVWISIP